MVCTFVVSDRVDNVACLCTCARVGAPCDSTPTTDAAACPGSAPQAAGVIHTDFEKGFIKAEVIAYDDFIKYGSEAVCRENGRLRIEGKEYLVQDGDVMHFRFNV